MTCVMGIPILISLLIGSPDPPLRALAAIAISPETGDPYCGDSTAEPVKRIPGRGGDRRLLTEADSDDVAGAAMEGELETIGTGQEGEEYAIQIGAFATKRNAERLSRRFTVEGYRTDIYENLPDGRNLIYLVWVGSYRSRDEAMEQIREIKKRYKIEGILTTRAAWKS